MRHLTELDLASLLPGRSGPPLLQAGSGCAAHVVRGCDEVRASVAPFDRFLFILKGRAAIVRSDAVESVRSEELLYVPSGAAVRVSGAPDTYWVEFMLSDELDPVAAIAPAAGDALSAGVRILHVDQEAFEGEGFMHQCMIDRAQGSERTRINMLKVDAGSGSPDFHIHTFDQYYLILEGEMQVDIGRTHVSAGPMTLVHLPAGVVHRNYNAGPGIERHISLLVPEPQDGEIFDYAVEVFDREAELMGSVPDLASLRPAAD
nr:cupin domain-containing protein [Sphingomonas sp. CDS-1]